MGRKKYSKELRDRIAELREKIEKAQQLSNGIAFSKTSSTLIFVPH
jgi:hypothetical protein